MCLAAVMLGPNDPIEPGVYHLFFDLPELMQDLVRSRPGWAERAARYAAEGYNADMSFMGGGLTWLPVDGQEDPVLVYNIRVRFHGSAGGGGGSGPRAAGVGGTIITVGVLVTMIAFAFSYGSLQLRGAIREAPDGAVEEGAAALRALADALRLTAIGALIYGGYRIVKA